MASNRFRPASSWNSTGPSDPGVACNAAGPGLARGRLLAALPRDGPAALLTATPSTARRDRNHANRGFGSQVPGSATRLMRRAIGTQRHETWARNCRKRTEGPLGGQLTRVRQLQAAEGAHRPLRGNERENAVHDSYQRPRPACHRRMRMCWPGPSGLDMAKAGWTVAGDSYLGRGDQAPYPEAVRGGRRVRMPLTDRRA